MAVFDAIADELVIMMVEAVPEAYGTISRLNWRYRSLLSDTARYKRLLARHEQYEGKDYWVLPNGDWHGKCLILFMNGEVSYEYTYVDDKKHGPCVSYLSNGGIDFACTYVNDRRHGEFVRYDLNGSVLEYGTYLNGEYHGKWVYYSNYGGRTSTMYNAGRLDGLKICHDESGSLTMRQVWDNDKLISTQRKFE